MSRWLLALVVLADLTLAACARPPELATRHETDAASATAAPAATAPSTDAMRPSSPAIAPPSEPSPLYDPSGHPLPQTDAEPSTTTDSFRRQTELLARAITEDNGDRALPFFFPLVAYQQVKAIANPERDWKLRLVTAFKRDVHAYAQKLGRDAARARLVGYEVPVARARWMKPGSEGNRLGYYRVLRSRLRFALPDGHEESLVVTSMISWRGEWYVVHLAGFQ